MFCAACGAHLERLRVQADHRRSSSEARRATAASSLVVVGVFVLLLADLGVQDADLAQLLVQVGFLLLALLAARVLGPEGPRDSLGAAPTPSGLGIGALAGGLSMGLTLLWWELFEQLPGLDFSEEPVEEVAPFLLLPAFLTVVMAPLSEEWLCRGALWSALSKLLDRRAVWVVSAAVFALLHGLGGGYILELPHRFLGGLVFGWLRLRGHGLGPCIAAHLVHNALAVAME